jgi:RNA polymerase sigma-B factor
MTALSQRTLLARTPFSDKPDPLVETRELFQVCDAIDDEREIERVRAEIVVLNLGLADRIAGHYRNRGIPAEDLQQVAYVGLCKAVQRFRPSEGVTFSAFASPTISGEIKRHFRDHGWMVRVPRRLQELRSEMRPVQEELTQALGRSPTVPEMATALGVSQDDVIEALASVSCYSPMQLEPPTEDGQRTLADVALVEDDGLERSDVAMILAPVLKRLTDRDRDLVRMRFFEELTQAQIGERLGVSQMQVSRLLSRLLQNLREQLGVAIG